MNKEMRENGIARASSCAAAFIFVSDIGVTAYHGRTQWFDPGWQKDGISTSIPTTILGAWPLERLHLCLSDQGMVTSGSIYHLFGVYWSKSKWSLLFFCFTCIFMCGCFYFRLWYWCYGSSWRNAVIRSWSTKGWDLDQYSQNNSRSLTTGTASSFCLIKEW